MGVPTNILANFWRAGGAGNVDCRIYDITNGNVICSLSQATPPLAATVFTSLGVISNLPAAPATFEVQLKRASGGQALIGGVIVEY